MSHESRHVNDGLFKICACARRAWPKCRHAWHFSFQDKGRLYRISLDKHLGRRVDSKTKAESEAEKIRTAIREGTFGQVAPRAEMTLRQLADVYLERYVAVERAARAGAFTGALGTVCKTEIPRPTEGTAPLGDWRLADIVTDTIERFREVRRGQGRGVIGTNRLLEHARALYNWAVRTGYVESSPFKRHGEPVVKLYPEPVTQPATERGHRRGREVARRVPAAPPRRRRVRP